MGGIQREGDPLIRQLSHDVFSLMNDIVSEEYMQIGYVEPPKQGMLATPQSLEDSIKELLSMKSSLK